MEQYIPKSVLVAKINKRITDAPINNIGHQRVWAYNDVKDIIDSLEVKEMDVWKTVDNINPPQADRNKIYCVFTKDRYILATVINHPKDEELLQWKCTEFPHHRYDMCERDKYMQIV